MPELARAIVPDRPHRRRTINRWTYGDDRRQDADVRKPARRGGVHVDRIISVVVGVTFGHTGAAAIVARMSVIVGVVEVRVIDVQTP